MHRNYIAGEWVAGEGINCNINPSDTEDIVGEYAYASAQQASEAIHAAATAQPAWATCSPEVRADALDRIGSEILARSEELGTLLAREEGKTRPEAVAEVVRAGRIFKFFASEALRVGGERMASVRPGVDIEVTREPEGVVVLITPWNFPIAIPAWKIAPALAYGNTVVFKPADLTPASAWALADIIVRCGKLPAGVFNLVMGRGAQVGDVLVRSERVKAVSFTGSASIGSRIGADCARRGAKFQLEMGGKNPLLVLDDADLEKAVTAAVQGTYFSTGQRCTGSSRLIVQEGIHDRFVDALVRRLRALKVGHALDPGTDMGPVVSEAQLNQDIEYVGIARAEGAQLLFGGDRLHLSKPGFYLSPALFVGTTNAMRINQEEVFGPVGTVIRVRDYEEGLAVANDSAYGLSAGICTTSLTFATDFKKRSASGMVMVNLPTAGVDYHVGFGGRKGSSYGPREQGSYAREFYTSTKTSYTLA